MGDENPYSRAVIHPPERTHFDSGASSTPHHVHCAIKPDQRSYEDRGGKSRIDVGLQRDREIQILMRCGSKVLRCWMETHLDLCFERKGACFNVPSK